LIEEESARVTTGPARFGLALAALLLAAASAGTAIPALKRLSAEASLSGMGAGLFVASHVAGTLAGAWALGRVSRGRGALAHWLGARSLAVAFAAAALGSGLANLALIRAFGPLAVSLLRLADGVLHVFLITVLMSLAVSPEPRRRRVQTAWFGGTLVAGIGLGMAAGGIVGQGEPRRAFVASAVMCLLVAALGCGPVGGRTLAALPDRGGGPRAGRGRASEERLAGLVVAAERFAMGILTVLLPFTAASSRQAGAVLGTLVTTSLLAAPGAMAIGRRSPRAAWASGGALLAAALLALDAAARAGTAAAIAWAAAAGAGAGLMYFGALAHAGGIADERARLRAVGLVHALGGAGFLVGSLLGGGLLALGGRAASGRPLAAVASAGLALALALLLWRRRGSPA
jgi:hypothetical protein